MSSQSSPSETQDNGPGEAQRVTTTRAEACESCGTTKHVYAGFCGPCRRLLAGSPRPVPGTHASAAGENQGGAGTWS